MNNKKCKESFINYIKRNYKEKYFGVLSGTWLYADYKKNLCSKKRYKRIIIKSLNSIYFRVCIVSLIFVLVFKYKGITTYQLVNPIKILWIYYLISRINEISYAFFMDALDKLKDKESSKSDLTGYDRIKLIFKSYFELIINFALLYEMTPLDYWKDGSYPTGLLDTLYFSVITITTTGYGDISPIHGWVKFLSMYEVITGIIMLVICFSIYGSYKEENNNNNNNSSNNNSSNNDSINNNGYNI